MSISHNSDIPFSQTLGKISTTYQGTIFEGIEYVFEQFPEISEIVLEHIGFSIEHVFNPDSKPLAKIFENKSSLLMMRTQPQLSIVDFLKLFREIYVHVKESLYLEVYDTEEPWTTLSDQVSRIDADITIPPSAHQAFEYPSDIVEKKIHTLKTAISQIEFETEPQIGQFFVYTIPTQSTAKDTLIDQEFVCGKITAKQNVSTQLVPVTVYEYDTLQYTTGATNSEFMNDSVIRPTHSDQLELYSTNPLI